ncbi:MAG TPA: CAP domain-containing protein [Bryobacteraceae bacterium]|nr:CAP domain-containing protein [Bryobacteraceae bacterium]
MKSACRYLIQYSVLTLTALAWLPAAPPPAVNTTAAILDSEEAAFLNLINQYRAEHGVGPLEVSPALQSSSKWMSTDMATKNYASHTDSLGRDPHARMLAFHYTYGTWGENIAGGFPDAQNALREWETACDPDESGRCTYAHRMNMLNRHFKVIGIGRAYKAGSRYQGWYWTTDFGGEMERGVAISAAAGSTSASGVSIIVSSVSKGGQ